MKMYKEITIKLYLKCKRKPFVITLDNESQIEQLKNMIETEKIVRFGLLMFKSDDFAYMIEQ